MNIGGMSGSGIDFSSIQSQVKERITEKFNSADVDGSGGISIDEFKEAASSRQAGAVNSADGLTAEEVFADLDTDGDGEITGSEMREKIQSQFAGGLSPSMLSALLAAQEAGSGSPFAADGPSNYQSNTFDQLMSVFDERQFSDNDD
jgi:hypothetical protein